jgi:hypothetical protein
MRRIVLLTLSALAACSSQPDTTPIKAAPAAAMSEYTLHEYAGNLTMQLLQNASVPLRGGAVVVGEFTALHDNSAPLSSDATPELGLQLQQSMQTLLSAAGFQVISFAGHGSLVTGSDNRMTIKPGKELPRSIKVDYVLNGTLTTQQHAYIVNTQLVDIATHHVVAAATSEIPLNVFWGRDQVQLRNGRLYRVEL